MADEKIAAAGEKKAVTQESIVSSMATKNRMSDFLAKHKWDALRKELDDNQDGEITKEAKGPNDKIIGDENIIDEEPEKTAAKEWGENAKAQLSELSKQFEIDLDGHLEQLEQFVTQLEIASSANPNEVIDYIHADKIKTEIEDKINSLYEKNPDIMLVFGQKNEKEMAIVSLLMEDDFLKDGEIKNYFEIKSHLKKVSKGDNTLADSISTITLLNAKERLEKQLGADKINDEDIKIKIENGKLQMGIIKGEDQDEIFIDVFKTKETKPQNPVGSLEDDNDGTEVLNNAPEWVKNMKPKKHFETMNAKTNDFENKVQEGFLFKILSWIGGKDFAMSLYKSDSPFGFIMRTVSSDKIPEKPNVSPITKDMKKHISKKEFPKLLQKLTQKNTTDTSKINEQLSKLEGNDIANNIATPVMNAFPETKIIDYNTEEGNSRESHTMTLQANSEADFAQIFSFLSPPFTDVKSHIDKIQEKTSNMGAVSDALGGVTQTGQDIVSSTSSMLGNINLDSAGGIMGFFQPEGASFIKGFKEFDSIKTGFPDHMNLRVDAAGNIVVKWSKDNPSAESTTNQTQGGK